MSSNLEIRPARKEEWPAAFGFIFQATSESDRPARIAHGIDMVRRGELQPEGIWVALEAGRVKGALVSLPVAGASALVWPPQTELDKHSLAIEDALLQAVCSWLGSRQVRIGQSLLTEHERALGDSLLRNGFRRITSLNYLRHDLRKLPDQKDKRLQYQTFLDADSAAFRRTLERTYTDTLDCPELNGIRTMDEIIAGHLTQGKHDPARWWLALDGKDPVAVLLLTEIPEWKAWDLSYLGVIPERRKQGVGRQLTAKALWEARQAGQSKLTLSVDRRNRPAQALYEKHGFFAYDSREVYLALWPAPK